MAIGAIQNGDDGLAVRTKLNTMIAVHDAGIVKSVSSGTNITVDNTDPENPVINASGTAGDMMSGTYDPQGKAADAFARANHTGTQSADTLTDGTTNKAYTATEKTKLAGIADGATANSSNAVLLARANHTGTQTAATISDFNTAADARISAAVGVSVQAYNASLTSWAALSSTAPQHTTIELGHASDTTLSRSAAGRLAVEGVDVLLAGTADQTISGGARVTVLSLGNLSGASLTPDPGDRPIQKITNNGAGSILPGSNEGQYTLQVINTTGAGAITTTGWTLKGDSFDTTTTSKFLCSCFVTSDIKLMTVVKVV